MKTLFFAVLFFSSITSFSQKAEFKSAKEADKIDVYNDFLLNYPESKYCTKINLLLEEKLANNAVETDKIDDYIDFLLKYPESKYCTKIKLLLDEKLTNNAVVEKVNIYFDIDNIQNTKFKQVQSLEGFSAISKMGDYSKEMMSLNQTKTDIINDLFVVIDNSSDDENKIDAMLGIMKIFPSIHFFLLRQIDPLDEEASIYSRYEKVIFENRPNDVMHFIHISYNTLKNRLLKIKSTNQNPTVLLLTEYILLKHLPD